MCLCISYPHGSIVRADAGKRMMYYSETYVRGCRIFFKELVMNFKKSLQTRLGQAMIEYFVMLAIIVLASAISMQVLWPGLRNVVQGDFFSRASAGIVDADMQ